MDASIVVRTFNEARWLPALFDQFRELDPGLSFEVIIVNSGSTDGTVAIAEGFGARILHIAKEDFSFGRSLNVGCAAASSRNLVFISGHCLPVGRDWLAKLVRPLEEGSCSYAYGRQVGHAELTKFSEARLFQKFFPARSRISSSIHCNNANAALLRSVWQDQPFDEALTGLEDMELAKRLVRAGGRIGYVAEAPVIHVHEESWQRVRIRFEREAVALQHIMPEVHLSLLDAARYCLSGVAYDMIAALRQRMLLSKAPEIVMYRLMQYWGTYLGNTMHRKLSRSRKEEYFYPAPVAPLRDAVVPGSATHPRERAADGSVEILA